MSTAEKRRPHEDCWLDEILDGKRCADGDPSTCRATAAAELRRRARIDRWPELEVRSESGGQRHYLEGRPVHCGDVLEMQGRETQADDYGEYTTYPQRGRLVRYELAWPSKPTTLDDRVVLYADVEGHTFTAALGGKRFRWPSRNTESAPE